MKQLAFLKEFAARHDLLYRTKSAKEDEDASDCYVYSPDMVYRYAFARWWKAKGSVVLWIGVNPGMGDTELRRRPTVERCIRWSRDLGASGLMFANLFAARHNKPRGLRDMPNPIGMHNNAVLVEMSKAAAYTVAAWGSWGKLHGRAVEVAPLLIRPLCLGLTSSGQPRHPLYVPNSTPFVPWSVESRSPDMGMGDFG